MPETPPEDAGLFEPPRSVIVLGAGTMGTGLALVFSRSGSHVHLRARRRESLERAETAIRESQRLPRAGHGHVDEPATAQLERIHMTTRLEALDPHASLVIETIREDLGEKRHALREIEDFVARDTVITTNTSSLPLHELAACLEQPDRFAGFHWFNPPQLVSLVEIVPSEATSASTVSTLRKWSTAVGKEPVTLTREVDGYIANRLQYALLREAYSLVESGACTMHDVDRAVRAGLGPRWAATGPFETMDFAGLDVHLRVARQLFPVLSNASGPPEVLEELVASGALGTKSGKGLLGEYSDDDVRLAARRRAEVVLAVASIVRRLAARGPD